MLKPRSGRMQTDCSPIELINKREIKRKNVKYNCGSSGASLFLQKFNFGFCFEFSSFLIARCSEFFCLFRTLWSKLNCPSITAFNMNSGPSRILKALNNTHVQINISFARYFTFTNIECRKCFTLIFFFKVRTKYAFMSSHNIVK